MTMPTSPRPTLTEPPWGVNSFLNRMRRLAAGIMACGLPVSRRFHGEPRDSAGPADKDDTLVDRCTEAVDAPEFGKGNAYALRARWKTLQEDHGNGYVSSAGFVARWVLSQKRSP